MLTLICIVLLACAFIRSGTLMCAWQGSFHLNLSLLYTGVLGVL